MHKMSLASKHNGQDNFIICFPKAWNFTSHITERTQRLWERGHTSCVPWCLLRVYQLRPELSIARLRKCLSSVPRALHDVCHTETQPNLPNRSESEPVAPRGTHTHTHTHTHTYTHTHTNKTSNVSTFSTTTYTWNAWHFVMSHTFW